MEFGTDIAAFNCYWQFYHNDDNFRKLIDENKKNGQVRFFGEDEWNRILSQNFLPPDSSMNEFIDMFLLGYNFGNCVGTSMQLSLSYNNVDIVSGILPMLKGTLNAEKEGGHCWLETPTHIIDTSLMLVIDKSLKSAFGYLEEQRVTASMLVKNSVYQARKKFANDKSIKRNSVGRL